MEENRLNELIEKLISEIRDLKTQMLIKENPISRDWIPRDLVMTYLGYQDTQMAYVAKKFNLTTSKIGKKKFYHRESIRLMLDANIVK